MKLIYVIAVFLNLGFSATRAQDAVGVTDDLEADKFSDQPPVFKYEPFIEFTPADHGPFRADVSITLYIPRDSKYFVLTDFSTSSWDWWGEVVWFHPYQRIAPQTKDLSKWPQFELPLFPEIEENQDWRWQLPRHPGFTHPRLRWADNMLDVR